MVKRVADRFAELKSALELAEVQAEKERVADGFYGSSLVLQVAKAWGREAQRECCSSSSMPDLVSSSGTDHEMWHSSSSSTDDEMTPPSMIAMNARSDVEMKAAFEDAVIQLLRERPYLRRVL